MRTALFIMLNIALTLCGMGMTQEQRLSESARNMRIQKAVHDLIGKNVTLNFKESESRSGLLVRTAAGELVLDVDGTHEQYPASRVRSLTIRPGVSEGLLVVLSSILVGGFGLGVAELSFEGGSRGIEAGVGAVFALIGGWIGYESFFQDIEIELP